MHTDLLDLLRCPATGSTLSLEPHRQDGTDVVHGVLQGETEEYPIVAGVPVLLLGYSESVRFLRDGRTADAASSALRQQLRGSPRARVAAALAGYSGAARVAAALQRHDHRRLRAALVPLLEAEFDPLAVVRFGFDGWAEHNPEAINYFTYRFGTPRHLVALAAADAVSGGTGPVLDLGCGAGHLTWGLGLRYGDRKTIGVDLSLFELWAARRIATSSRLVCADATRLPFRSDAFGLVMASDVLSFVRDKWALAREATRVMAPDGAVAIAAVKNSRHDHVYAGMPLSPRGWVTLTGDLPHQLYADDRILERYLSGQPISADDPGDVDAARTVTLIAGSPSGHSTAEPVTWPHARGPLGVNPLLRLASDGAGELVYARRFPSQGFADDNVPLRRYLPDEVTIPRRAVVGDELDPEQVESLLPGTAVLALPEIYRRARLPGFAKRAVLI